MCPFPDCLKLALEQLHLNAALLQWSCIKERHLLFSHFPFPVPSSHCQFPVATVVLTSRATQFPVPIPSSQLPQWSWLKERHLSYSMLDLENQDN
jgi:hypothetical protein